MKENDMRTAIDLINDYFFREFGFDMELDEDFFLVNISLLYTSLSADS